MECLNVFCKQKFLNILLLINSNKNGECIKLNVLILSDNALIQIIKHRFEISQTRIINKRVNSITELNNIRGFKSCLEQKNGS